MAEEAGEKSQDATPHRRQQAREEGQVVHSQDLGSATILVVGIGLLMAMGLGIAMFFGELTTEHLGEAWLDSDPGFVQERWIAATIGTAKVVLPVLALLLLANLCVHWLQIGFLWLPEKLMPDFARISPLAGFGRLFSLQNSVRLIFGMLKTLLVAGVAFWSLYHRREEILASSAMELPTLATFLADIVLWTCMKIALALLILAALDYLFQRWKHDQDLKMTPQEVREEMKNLQGDPQIIARRRQVQRALVLNRLSTAVPKADVVITNPTELAIAVQYDIEKMKAPIVVAKGSGLMAQRIRLLALENAIPIVEKKPLAQLLFKEVEVNHPIPDKAYAAVAEILAYVYQLKGKPIPGQGN